MASAEQRFPRPQGLVLRLLAAAVAAGLLVGTIGALVQHRSARQALRGEIAERNATLAAELAARVDDGVRDQLEVLGAVASQRSVEQLDPDADQALRELLSVSTIFDELVLYGASGRPVAAAASRFQADLADYEDGPAPPDGPVIEITADFPPEVEMMVSVENPPGTTVGTLLGRAPLEVLVPLALRVDADGTVRMVVDRSGIVLVHPARDRVLQRERVPIEEVLDDDRVAVVDREGEGHMLAGAPTLLLPAAVVLDQPESTLLAPSTDRLRQLTVILALVVVAIVLAVSIAGTWLLAPLRPLRAAVSRLGRYERGVRVHERSPGEVGELAAEFNRLAETLDRRRDEVEQLQRLSLLVNSRTSVEAIADEVVDGVVRLIDAERAAFCTGGDTERPPEVIAARGPVSEPAKIERATIAIRIRRPHIDSEGTDHFVAMPISTVDGEVVGALIAARSDTPFEQDEIALAEAYAAFAGVAVDNARRLALEQELAAELQQAVEQRRGLLGTLSHEFRTPLTCIDGFSTSLLDDWERFDDQERRALVDKIRHHGSELSDLVNRLLDFAVTERGKLDAALRPVRLDEQVHLVVEAMEPVVADRELEVDVPAVEVTADPTLLQRAVTNLVSNAVKYSPTDTPITIRAVADGRITRLEVVDQGAGLAADEAARAFQPFWRAGDSTTRSQRGAGLGLALVSEYARAMGGSAGVVSEPGHGSTFFLILDRAGQQPDA